MDKIPLLSRKRYHTAIKRQDLTFILIVFMRGLAAVLAVVHKESAYWTPAISLSLSSVLSLRLLYRCASCPKLTHRTEIYRLEIQRQLLLLCIRVPTARVC